MQYNVFRCHASEDKEDFVRPLAELLRQQQDVWYDEFSLEIGDANRFNNSFPETLVTKKRKQLKFTKTIKNGLSDLMVEASKNLEITQDPEKIIQKLIDIDIVKSYYDYKDWLNEQRRR